MEHFDLIIVGAGLSGIGAAHYFTEKCPGKTFAILESRDAIGGTWDLFRYPGIRSDSDMHTLGYDFKPWKEKKAIADGPAIWDYINETAKEDGSDKHIRYDHKVISAEWSSDNARWTLNVTHKSGKGTSQISCNFLSMCAGYYDYDEGFTPVFEGREDFEGMIVHPQKWPEDLDYKDKKVVVIGSGATAVTLVPSMADKAAKVTMLQRSPTYMINAPSKDWISNFLRKILPEQTAYNLVRKKNVWRQSLLYKTSQKSPEKIKKYLRKQAIKALGNDFPFDPHLTPSYNPWDERLCLIPDGDLYESLNAGKAEIVTDHIDHFTKTGLALKSGAHLDADIIVTATGLNLVVLGSIDVMVDGQEMDFTQLFAYEGMMFSDIPNLISTFGYVNASWTLRADLNARFMCRLINYMEANGVRQVTPRAPDDMPQRPWLDFAPGYVRRVLHMFPHQGDREPWLNTQDYIRDRKVLAHHPLDDGYLIFTNPAESEALEAAQ
ncbi:MAG: NAD(P)/FAD-dependent oxidoreductase [Acidimicrobiales bacterium]|nr:NAD(P)/FAD-dependent oxidoreductase [Hyphomonadaceae bacterium]RZV42143.1 MAG: NAD(P)/FAD-dependent oxidoreductase [Acidimicrobiales bacterium]